MHVSNSVPTQVAGASANGAPLAIANQGEPPSPSALDETVPSPAGRVQGGKTLPEIDGYEVLEEIGRGGMGAVYRARQRAAGGRVVALKVMLGEAFASSSELRRFEREVEIASDLNHASIAHIYDSGLIQGRHYFAMEYVEGQALDTFCKTRDLPVKARLRLFAAVCEAVAYAHRRGVIHRDLKPSNILVDNDGVPHVLDFGLAKTQPAVGEAAMSRPELTMDGTLLGTLPYMAPEQAEGKVSAIDTRTDVYALGVILYLLLTGKYPYEVTGQMADVLQRIAEAEPKRPSTVNRLIGDEVEMIILRALHKLPDRRYSGADDLARDVTHFLVGEPIEAKRDSGLYVLRKTLRRYRVPLAFAASIVVLLAASAVVSFRLYRSAQVEYRRAETERDQAETARRQESAAKVQAEASQRQAEQQRAFAQASEQEATRRLARLHFNEGVKQWFERQDAAFAAAYFAEALRVSPDPLPAARLALHNALQACPQMQFPPIRERRYVAFSPDGGRVFTASKDGTTRVWDAATGQPVSVPMKHSKKIRSATFTADGGRVLTVSDDKSARVWDATTGKLVSDTIRVEGSLEAVAFSPDGKRIVTASTNNTAQLWDAETGRPVSATMKHSKEAGYGYVQAVAFSPDGKRVGTASSDGTARVWDAVTGQPVSVPMEDETQGGIDKVNFSADGRCVLTVSFLTARVWDAVTGKPVSAQMQHVDEIFTAAFSPDGKQVLTASKDGTARVWDAATGQPISVLHHDLGVKYAAFSSDQERILTTDNDGNSRIRSIGKAAFVSMQGTGRSYFAEFSPDGKWVLAASSNGTARVWDAATGQLVSPMKHGGSAYRASFSPDGKWVLTESLLDKTARVWNAATFEQVSGPFDGYYRDASFSPDGKWILAVSNTAARVWDAATGQPISPPLKHEAKIFVAQFSPDGGRVFTSFSSSRELRDEIARVWDAATGEPVSAPMQHNGSIHTAVFSPDGKRVLTMSRMHGVWVWDAITGQLISTIIEGKTEVQEAAFSPDGNSVLITEDQWARVYDAATGQPLSAPMKHASGVADASFSPDGTRVLTASADRTARVWDALTGQPISAPMQHKWMVFIGRFSPDGRWVLTVEYDLDSKISAARLWDAATGQPVSASMPISRLDMEYVAVFSPDGKRVLIAWDEGVRVWHIADADWEEPVALVQARVRARLGVAVDSSGDVQPLTAEELSAAWKEYERLKADYLLSPTLSNLRSS